MLILILKSRLFLIRRHILLVSIMDLIMGMLLSLNEVEICIVCIREIELTGLVILRRWGKFLNEVRNVHQIF
jgi:hypothetical protein